MKREVARDMSDKSGAALIKPNQNQSQTASSQTRPTPNQTHQDDFVPAKDPKAGGLMGNQSGAGGLQCVVGAYNLSPCTFWFGGPLTGWGPVSVNARFVS